MQFQQDSHAASCLSGCTAANSQRKAFARRSRRWTQTGQAGLNRRTQRAQSFSLCALRVLLFQNSSSAFICDLWAIPDSVAAGRAGLSAVKIFAKRSDSNGLRCKKPFCLGAAIWQNHSFSKRFTIHRFLRKIQSQGNDCQGNGKERLPVYSSDNHSPDCSPAFFSLDLLAAPPRWVIHG